MPPIPHQPPASPAAAQPRRIELRLQSHAAQVAEARRAVEQLAADTGFDAAAQGELGLCVNEALANVIRHAYGGVEGRPIVVAAEYSAPVDGGSPALRVTIRDWGNGVNPTDLPPKPRDPLQPGGLGLVCLRKLMNAVTFTPQPDGGMLLTMVKTKSC